MQCTYQQISLELGLSLSLSLLAIAALYQKDTVSVSFICNVLGLVWSRSVGDRHTDCDDTQNLNETKSETFFDTKLF